MPTILVLEDDAPTRDALAEVLRRLFPRARVIATSVDAGAAVGERDGACVVLAGVVAVDRVRRSFPSARVVALTREMGPDTLLRAEALGVDASLRATAGAGQLRAVLEPMLDGRASRGGAAGEASLSDPGRASRGGAAGEASLSDPGRASGGGS